MSLVLILCFCFVETCLSWEVTGTEGRGTPQDVRHQGAHIAYWLPLYQLDWLVPGTSSGTSPHTLWLMIRWWEVLWKMNIEVSTKFNLITNVSLSSARKIKIIIDIVNNRLALGYLIEIHEVGIWHCRSPSCLDLL